MIDLDVHGLCLEQFSNEFLIQWGLLQGFTYFENRSVEYPVSYKEQVTAIQLTTWICSDNNWTNNASPIFSHLHSACMVGNYSLTGFTCSTYYWKWWLSCGY